MTLVRIRRFDRPGTRPVPSTTPIQECMAYTPDIFPSPVTLADVLEQRSPAGLTEAKAIAVLSLHREDIRTFYPADSVPCREPEESNGAYAVRVVGTAIGGWFEYAREELVSHLEVWQRYDKTEATTK